MQKHFFTFQKTIDGKRQPIYIEVIVAETVSRKQARQIAEHEINEFRTALRQWKRIEPQMQSIPDFRFVGAN